MRKRFRQMLIRFAIASVWSLVALVWMPKNLSSEPEFDKGRPQYSDLNLSRAPSGRDVAQIDGLDWQSFEKQRWELTHNGEGQLCLSAYADAGYYINAPVCFNRRSGEIRFDGPTTFSSVMSPISGGAAGPTFSAHNVGPNGAVGLLGQYFSAANGKGFDLGAEFIANFNPVTWQEGNNGQPGPGDMAQWIVAVSPNDTLHNWGTNVVEYNIVNRGPDKGWRRDRGLQPVTGGLVVVAEASVFGDPGGGEGKNALYGYTAAKSASVNSTGLPVKLYNDFLCEPNSEASMTGRCLYATGDITGIPSQIPFSPVQVDGSWLHGLDTTKASLSDNLALRMRPGQSLGFVSEDEKVAMLTSEAVNGGISLTLAPSGPGKVVLNGDSVVKGSLTAGALQVTGHFSGAGSGVPAVSDGDVDERSTDTRGSVNMHRGIVRTMVTFASPFLSPPFCTLTGNRTESTKAVVSTTGYNIILEVSKNDLGETLTWHCIQ